MAPPLAPLRPSDAAAHTVARYEGSRCRKRSWPGCYEGASLLAERITRLPRGRRMRTFLRRPKPQHQFGQAACEGEKPRTCRGHIGRLGRATPRQGRARDARRGPRSRGAGLRGAERRYDRRLCRRNHRRPAECGRAAQRDRGGDERAAPITGKARRAVSRIGSDGRGRCYQA